MLNTTTLQVLTIYVYLGARNRNYYCSAGLNGLGRRYNNVFQPMG